MAAFLVGVAKTAIGGVAIISVAIYAAVMPARESTAALLLLLVIGDIIAVLRYHRHADWGLIGQLLPGVLPGLAVGTVVLAVVDDTTLRRGIGGVLLALLALQLWLRRGGDEPDGVRAGRPWGRPARTASGVGAVRAGRPWGRPARTASGVGAGFATMVANAAGPVMTLYLLGQRVDKLAFLGTSAWFFLCVNLAKLPLSAGLGLLSWSTMATTVVLTPAVVTGGLVGARLVRPLRQPTFEAAVLVASAVSAAALLVR